VTANVGVRIVSAGTVDVAEPADVALAAGSRGVHSTSDRGERRRTLAPARGWAGSFDQSGLSLHGLVPNDTPFASHCSGRLRVIERLCTGNGLLILLCLTLPTLENRLLNFAKELTSSSLSLRELCPQMQQIVGFASSLAEGGDPLLQTSRRLSSAARISNTCLRVV
jgi:hypothetical protein